MAKELSLTEQRNVMGNLERLLALYKGEVEEAERLAKDAEATLAKTKEQLARTRALIQDQQERYGEQLRLADTGPYAGLSLRDAATRVISEAQGEAISAGAIITKLKDSGFVIDSDFPGRALHAALMRVEQIERAGEKATKTYRWIGGDDAAG